MGKAAEMELEAILQRMRMALSKRGHHAVVVLSRTLHAHDAASAGYLNYAEFEHALARLGIFLPLPQMTLLNRRFDLRQNRSIAIDAFLGALIGPLSPPRLALVDTLFATLSSSDVGDFMARVHPERHPAVLAQEKTAAGIRGEIEAVVQYFSEGGRLTREAVLGIFAAIGATIPLNETRFADILGHVFHVTVTDTATDFVDRGYLASVGLLKEKIRQKTKGQESEALTLMKVFRHFDVGDSGKVTLEEWERTLERFGILMPEKEIRALFAEHDRAGEGAITYATFVQDLYAHP